MEWGESFSAFLLQKGRSKKRVFPLQLQPVRQTANISCSESKKIKF